MTDQPTRLLLVRHALNDFIVERRLAGRLPGVYLNEAGRVQAVALAERLAGVPLAAVYSSPLERTAETAQRVAARHGLAVQPDERLAESDCGAWTGRALEELEGEDLWRQIRVAPSGVRFPGGESFAEIQARMVHAIEDLRQRHAGEQIVLVSHSDPIKLALAHYMGLHMDMFQRLVIDPASISEIEFGSFQPRLLRCNDCAHLPPQAAAAAQGNSNTVPGEA